MWRVRAGEEPPMHVHRREDETIYLLEGEVTAFVGDARFEVPAGTYAALPRDIPHGLRVKGTEAKLLVTLLPGGAERFFVPEAGTSPDPADFGIDMLGPVPA